MNVQDRVRARRIHLDDQLEAARADLRRTVLGRFIWLVGKRWL